MKLQDEVAIVVQCDCRHVIMGTGTVEELLWMKTWRCSKCNAVNPMPEIDFINKKELAALYSETISRAKRGLIEG